MAVAMFEYGLFSSRSFQRGTEGVSVVSGGRHTSLAVGQALAQSQFWRQQGSLREAPSGPLYRTRYISVEPEELKTVDFRPISDEEDNDWW